MILLKALYVVAALGLALYGIQAAILSVLYLRHRKTEPVPPKVRSWPRVTIQLPLFNEMYVAERLLRSVVRIQYPRAKLQIQVLDDSTDETTQILSRAVERYRAEGHHIELVHRTNRSGFKAGALHEAMSLATGEYIAVFDADFVPPAAFLLRTIPYFSTDERLGMIQTRWGHTNSSYSTLTRAQSIALDGHFIVEQTGRQRSGLFMSFNGTAGIWRRECIENSGGWSADTLCEDLDLSFRAQLSGWRCLFLPHVESPAEIPPQMAALKVQQSRWAEGSIQCLLKLWRKVITADKPVATRLLGLVHLGAYAAHPMGLLLLLCTLPLLIGEGGITLPLAWLSLTSLGPPMMHTIAQRRLHRDWTRRLLYFPVLMLIGTGLAWKNTGAVLKALCGKKSVFGRTPKFQLFKGSSGWENSRYALKLDWSNVGETFMMLYAGAAIAVSIIKGNPYLIPFLSLYFLGFGYVGVYDVWRKLRPSTRREETLRRRGKVKQATHYHPGQESYLSAQNGMIRRGRSGLYPDLSRQ